MAKVKIFLEKGETLADADNALFKALNHHASGDVHLRESFDDPAMVDAANRMEELFKKQYKEMIDEIIATLESEYNEW